MQHAHVSLPTHGFNQPFMYFCVQFDWDLMSYLARFTANISVTCAVDEELGLSGSFACFIFGVDKEVRVLSAVRLDAWELRAPEIHDFESESLKLTKHLAGRLGKVARFFAVRVKLEALWKPLGGAHITCTNHTLRTTVETWALQVILSSHLCDTATHEHATRRGVNLNFLV